MQTLKQIMESDAAAARRPSMQFKSDDLSFVEMGIGGQVEGKLVVEGSLTAVEGKFAVEGSILNWTACSPAAVPFNLSLYLLVVSPSGASLPRLPSLP